MFGFTHCTVEEGDSWLQLLVVVVGVLCNLISFCIHVPVQTHKGTHAKSIGPYQLKQNYFTGVKPDWQERIVLQTHFCTSEREQTLTIVVMHQLLITT